jgi:hypothetical protein
MGNFSFFCCQKNLTVFSNSNSQNSNSNGFFYSPLQSARKVGGLEDEGKGDEIAHENANEENVAQFTTRGTYDGRVVISAKERERERLVLINERLTSGVRSPQEDSYHKDSKADAYESKDHRTDRPPVEREEKRVE